MKRFFIISVVAAASLFGGSIGWRDSVPVVRSKPVYQMVTIRDPYQVCYNRRVPVVYENGNAEVPAAIIGGAAGGVLGHQIGKGRGRDAATIGGAVLGALAGVNMVQPQRRVVYRMRRICKTRYRIHRERRFVHYKNVAWYRGYKIVKFSSRPLKRIPLKVTVSY